MRNGHYVIAPHGEPADPTGSGCTLPRLGRDETIQAMVAMDIGEVKARALARSTARRLQVVRRQLVDEAGGPTPVWASTSTPHSIVALVLIGEWNGDNEEDKAIAAEVAGQTYETVERDLVDLTSVADSPLTKVGNRWRFISHEEAWHLLAPRLTSSDLKRFESITAKVFGAVSPELDLPMEERYMAQVLGKVLPHSSTLRKGIARSLALMGTYSGHAKNADSSWVPVQVVSTALGGGKGWQVWATLDSDLAVLAEASPEAFLDAVEGDLATIPSPFKELLARKGDSLLGGVPLHRLDVGIGTPGVVPGLLCKGRKDIGPPHGDRLGQPDIQQPGREPSKPLSPLDQVLRNVGPSPLRDAQDVARRRSESGLATPCWSLSILLRLHPESGPAILEAMGPGRRSGAYG